MSSNLVFPLDLQFKISTLSNDFVATNANAESIAYIRQKLFKFVEEIEIFETESEIKKLYDIRADRWLDFNANYSFFQDNQLKGSIARKGWASLWSARYMGFDESKDQLFSIQEDNPFAKVMDALIGQIPFFGLIVGYIFNPTYSAFDNQGKFLAKLRKMPSFWGRKFKIESNGELGDVLAEKVFLCFTMLVLLERRRG